MEENKNNRGTSNRSAHDPDLIDLESLLKSSGAKRPVQNTVRAQASNQGGQQPLNKPQSRNPVQGSSQRQGTPTQLPEGAVIKQLRVPSAQQPKGAAQPYRQAAPHNTAADSSRPAAAQRSGTPSAAARPAQSGQPSVRPTVQQNQTPSGQPRTASRPNDNPQNRTAPANQPPKQPTSSGVVQKPAVKPTPSSASGHAQQRIAPVTEGSSKPKASDSSAKPTQSEGSAAKKHYSSHQQDDAQSAKLPVRRQPSSPQLEDPQSVKEWEKLMRARQQKQYARESASSAIMSAVKAVVYIVFVIAVSIPLSIFVINTANDVFAFVKEEKIIEVTIPEYATIEDIGEILGEAGVIKYPWAFNLWSNIKERRSIEAGNYPEFIAGSYEISTTLNYDYLRASFKKRKIRETVDIMIPEGYTIDEMIDLFVSHGIGTREGFVDVINNYDFDYRFIDELTVTDDRIYRLEGYLFPDTYQFYTDSSEVTVINKLLANFNIKFAEGYYDRCIDLGITVDEAIIIASMIEKEARYANDFGYVSSVFHNRIKYKSSFPYLNSDATIMYAIQHDSGSRLDTMTGEDLDYETAYNTYTNRGLPPGPIANPGLNAIKYALYPNDSKYFYFVSDTRGHMLYAETDAEHQQNIITARTR